MAALVPVLIKSAHIGGVARRELGDKVCVRPARRCARQAWHFSDVTERAEGGPLVAEGRGNSRHSRNRASYLNSHIGRPCRGRTFASLTDRAPASASLKVVEPRLRPHHAVLIAPGLWLASPKNGNISNVGRRLSAISLPSCANWEY